MHGGIGNEYGVGNGIGYDNDMDVDANGTRRIAITRKTPEDEIAKKAKHQSSMFQVVLHSSSMQQNEEKKIDKITFENVCKKTCKFLCTNTPTIVVTPIKSKELKSATPFIGLRNKNALSSGLFVHFAVDVNEQQLITSMMRRMDKSNKKKIKIVNILHSLLNKRKSVNNPEVNRYVLLRGVSTRESDDEIKKIMDIKYKKP
ncbi:hypothetical protein RFI_21681 [Reticulomyxa filosa]|uniref:Uncharacterized protein n=1 Tax=Reticulomyxa filosa TaxID=46433 RepID=X6MNV6_RETFI|nr:hypothetical protein RFI_21681 [Reticulomyxa filosa]|eukprot:ETO15683.1 hypothetical protein RFI_21681 [Reticulomyxa filosa]